MKFKIALVGEAWGKQTAILDEEDYERVIQFRWCAIRRRAGLYHAMRKDKRFNTVFMHRFILGLSYKDGKIVDHINGDGLDNRRCNLRIVSARENALNTERSRNAKIIEKHGNRFRVRPYVDGTRINLGSFSSEEEALAILRNFRDEI